MKLAMPGDFGSSRLSNLTDFGSNPGSLLAKVYTPERLPSDAPLVVVLHGCTQTAAGYDHGAGWSRMADRHGFALLFPEQQRSNNANLCFNWFVPEDCRRDCGEALSIRQMIETMVALHGIDRQRIFINGLSAGGAMTSVMLATYPEVFAGGAIIGGMPHGIAKSIPEAFDRMRGHGGPSEPDLRKLLRDASNHVGPWPTISVWHGASDYTVASSNADDVVAQWRGVHGLVASPPTETSAKGVTKRRWLDANGRALIEDYRIEGMGHGTPINSDDGIAGPFMLDVGISSTRALADAWSLTASSPTTSSEYPKPSAPIENATRTMPPRVEPTTSPPAYSSRSNDKTTSPRKTTGIRKTIEDALRAAGLLQ